MKIFGKIWVGAVLALAGCGTVPNPISQVQVYQLENGYGVAQSGAVAYAALPRCAAQPVQPCSKAKVVVALAKADKQARLALDAVEAFARNPSNYPGLSYPALLSAAQTAVATLQQIEATK